MKIFIDIETLPQQPEDSAKAEIAENINPPSIMKKQETIDQWINGEGKYAGERDALIEDQYLKTAFDGGKGEICSIAVAIGDSEILNFTRLGVEQPESLILDNFISFLSNDLTKGTNPYFIGHYLNGFDLKFLFHRLVINNINPEFNIPFNGRHGVDFYDNMTAWAGYKDRVSQDNLCKALGIKVDKPDGMDGSKVYQMWKEGKYDVIGEYNKGDVDECRQIYKRLNFLTV